MARLLGVSCANGSHRSQTRQDHPAHVSHRGEDPARGEPAPAALCPTQKVTGSGPPDLQPVVDLHHPLVSQDLDRRMGATST
jgi:hypothetical protein